MHWPSQPLGRWQRLSIKRRDSEARGNAFPAGLFYVAYGGPSAVDTYTLV